MYVLYNTRRTIDNYSLYANADVQQNYELL